VIVPVAALLLVLAPAAMGGRLALFAQVRLRNTEIAAAAFWLQLAGLELLPGPPWLLRLLHIGSYTAAAAFLRANRRVPGLWLVALGAASNGITIVLNGGTLPASAQALERAGIGSDATGFVNSGMLARPRLPLLGDVFAVPAGWPLSNVFSVGDVLVVLGVGWAAARVCGTRWTAPWDARAAGHARGRHLTGAAGAGVASRDAAGANPQPPDRPRRRARRARRRDPRRGGLLLGRWFDGVRVGLVGRDLDRTAV
jgi:hypothetical protein